MSVPLTTNPQQVKQAQQPKDYNQFKFKSTYTLEKRIKIVQQAKKKHPNSYIVVLEKHPKSSSITLPQLRHSRFIIQNNTKILELLQAIKDRLKAIDPKLQASSGSLYFIVGKKIPKKDSVISEIYKDYYDKDDKILYMNYADVQPF